MLPNLVIALDHEEQNERDQHEVENDGNEVTVKYLRAANLPR